MSSCNIRRPAELEPLLALSAYIGRDPMLTQASAGNTSMKIDGRLWIKASGKWLADALQDDMFLPLDLAEARNCVSQQRGIDTMTINSSGEELRPSVEAPLHAVLPQRVVVHVHSVNTLARAVRLDACEHLETLLNGLSWAWIPYVPSGPALAREIERVLGSSSVRDVLILGNHGLVVCGDSCEAVEELLKQVEFRMGAIPRTAPRYDRKFLLKLAEGSRWRLPEHTRLHCLATDETSRSILANGVLYACQAVFLRGSYPWRPFYSGLYSEAARHRNQSLSGSPFLIFKNEGVLLSESITRTELETLIGLADVVQRLDTHAPIRYLTKAECDYITSDNVYRSRETLEQIALSA